MTLLNQPLVAFKDETGAVQVVSIYNTGEPVAPDQITSFLPPDVVEWRVLERSESQEQEYDLESQSWLKSPPTRADIDRERDRRMGQGAVVPISGYDPIHVTGNPSDQIIFGSLIDTARYLTELGVSDPVITFRDANNVNHMLTPAQITELVMGGRAAGAAIYEASWVLKDNPPIPDDYADDAHWPALIPDGEPE